MLVEKGLAGQEKSKMKSFVFRENNGNYSVVLENSDLSWTKGDFLYNQQVDENLEETEVDQVAMKNLSLE